jgi:putative membrane protein insertion efficiency factor
MAQIDMLPAVHGLIRLPGMLLILAVRLYQFTIGPMLGPVCRFQPSCSNYFIEAVQKHGAVRGSIRGVGRILRCHPWHPGGYDPP